MTQIIIKLDPEMGKEKMDSMIQEGFNMGFTNFLANGEGAKRLSEIERVTLYSTEKNENAIQIINSNNIKDQLDQIIKNESGIATVISDKEDELRAIKWANSGVSFLVCTTTDWKIIPFENLIANISTLDCQLYADVKSSLEEVDLLIHTLETGVDGVIFEPKTENDLVDLKQLLKISSSINLEYATIESITPISEADRVCVDTSSMLRPGEGMLVGNTAKGFALVHAEVFESEFVNSRPFRVNAGDVSEYILVPDIKNDGSVGYRTNYLSELKAGDQALVCDVKGNTRIVSLGRVKIETRPMLLFKLTVKHDDENIPLIVTIQNAETVRVVDLNKKAISGTDLKVGDEIMVHVGPGATHFGTAIKETIIEK